MHCLAEIRSVAGATCGGSEGVFPSELRHKYLLRGAAQQRPPQRPQSASAQRGRTPTGGARSPGGPDSHRPRSGRVTPLQRHARRPHCVRPATAPPGESPTKRTHAVPRPRTASPGGPSSPSAGAVIPAGLAAAPSQRLHPAGELLVPPKRRPRTLLDAQRRNAVNNVALKTLLQSKVCTAPTGMKLPGTDASPDPRLTSLLAYLRCATESVEDERLDLSDCPLTTDDFVVLKSVLAGHPRLRCVDLRRVGVPQPGPAPLSTAAAANLVAAVAENPHIVAVTLEGSELPNGWAERVERQLAINREYHEEQGERARQRRLLRLQRREAEAHAQRLAGVLCEEAAESQRLAREEKNVRQSLAQAAVRAALRARHLEGRRERRERREQAAAEETRNEFAARVGIELSERAEFLVVAEVEEEAMRCRRAMEEADERLLLKRGELVGWSRARRREKDRKEGEREARAQVMEDFLTRMGEEEGHLDRALSELGQLELTGRQAAMRRQERREEEEDAVRRRQEAARQKREQDELWRRKQEQLLREQWEAKREREREQVVMKEERGRKDISKQWMQWFVGPSGAPTEPGSPLPMGAPLQPRLGGQSAQDGNGIFSIMERCWRGVIAAQTAMADAERLRDTILKQRVLVDLDLSATKANPRKFYCGLQKPEKVAGDVKLTVRVPPDYVDRIHEAEKQHRRAVQQSRDARELANEQLTDLWRKWDVEKEKDLRQSLRAILMELHEGLWLPSFALGPRMTAFIAALVAAALGTVGSVAYEWPCPEQAETGSEGPTPTAEKPPSLFVGSARPSTGNTSGAGGMLAGKMKGMHAAGRQAAGLARLTKGSKRMSRVDIKKRDPAISFFPEAPRKTFPPVDQVRKEKETIWGGRLEVRVVHRDGVDPIDIEHDRLYCDTTWSSTVPQASALTAALNRERRGTTHLRERSMSRMGELERAIGRKKSIMADQCPPLEAAPTAAGRPARSRKIAFESSAEEPPAASLDFSPPGSTGTFGATVASPQQGASPSPQPDASPQQDVPLQRGSAYAGSGFCGGSEGRKSHGSVVLGDSVGRKSVGDDADAPRVPRRKRASSAHKRQSVVIQQMAKSEVRVAIPSDGSATTAQVAQTLEGVSFSIAHSDIDELLRHVPFERRLEISLVLHFRDDTNLGCGQKPAAGHLMTVNINAWVSMIAVAPYVYADPSERLVVYEEDSTPDSCAFLHKMVVTDPVVVAAVDERGRTVVAPTEEGDRYKVMKGGEGLSCFDKGFLRLRFKEGYTPDDVILFHWSEHCALKSRPRKELLHAMQEYAVVRGARPRSMVGEEPEKETMLVLVEDYHRPHGDELVPFAELVQGQVFSTSRVPTKPVPGNNVIMFKLHTRLATADNVQRLLRRLRYGNFSQDPEPGTRVVEIALADGSGDPCIIDMSVDVVSSDDPAVMDFAAEKVFFRIPAARSVPPELQKYVPKSIIRPALGAVVTDVDTDRFVGGYLDVGVTSGYNKGDALLLCCPVYGVGEEVDPVIADSQTVHVRQAKGDAVPFSPHGVRSPRAGDDGEETLDCIYFEGRHIGTLVRGLLHDTRASRQELEELVQDKDEDDCSSVSVLFSGNGGASIASCSKLLETIAWTSILPRPKEGERWIDFCLQVGRSLPKGATEIPPGFGEGDGDGEDLDAPLEEKVRVVVTPELFEVSQPNNTYREGSGEQRIAPFELLQDTMGYDVETYQGGYVLVELIEGCTEDDKITLREGDLFKIKSRSVTSDFISELPQQLLQRPTDSGILPRCPSTTPSALGLQTIGPSVADDGGATSPGEMLKGFGAKNGGKLRAAAGKIAAQSPQGRLSVSPPIPQAEMARQSSTPGKEDPCTPNLNLASAVARVRGGISTYTRANLGARDETLLLSYRMVQQKIKQQAEARGEMTRQPSAIPGRSDRDKEPGFVALFEVTEAAGRTHVMGHLGTAFGWMAFAFGPKSGVKRADVKSILRNLCFENDARVLDPDSLRKIVRVTVNDGGQCSSYAIVQVDIQEVDDVTDVVLKVPKVLWRPMQSRTPTAICQLGSSWLDDPDTQFFDGGTLSFELIAGHTKSDVLSWLTVDEQSAAWRHACAQPGSKSLDAGQSALSGDPPLLDLRPDGSIVEVSTGTKIGTVQKQRIPDWAPSNNLKVNFVPPPPEGPSRVPINLASYILSCVGYTNSADKLPSGPRVYSISILDPGNPHPGRGKVTMEVLPCLLCISGGTAAQPPKWTDEIACRGDCIAQLCPQAQVNFCVVNPAQPEAKPASSVALALPRAPAPGGKAGAAAAKETLSTGFLSIAVTRGWEEGDTVLFDKKATDVRDGQLYFGRDLVGKCQQAPERLVVEFLPTTKLRVPQLRDLIRLAAVKLVKRGGVRTAEITLQDATGPRYATHCTVRVSPPRE
eukprot:TRINITY_DN5903_c0_g2_i2.p1 TRINITY_DN5903_c0_g2~~TRINITY_DN5903_c0_g2_i2.p1  ORF type:complete len:2392 (+),score=681.15 TRINITY_DN5903_c0_g2_i2:107-7282(+)